jgi:hypothetical protein
MTLFVEHNEIMIVLNMYLNKLRVFAKLILGFATNKVRLTTFLNV